MPVMDGLEATRRVRAQAPAHRPWIIALTAGALAGDQEACAAAGTDAFLPKPITSTSLAAALSAVPRPAAEPPVNSKILQDLFDSLGCGPEGTASFLDQFLSSCETHVASLTDALSTADLPAAARAAHALRSPCAMFGASPLARLLRECETWAASGTPDAEGRAEHFRVHIRDEHARLIDALTAWSLVGAQP
jgi:CheY-like chemotaxis protein